MRASAWDKFILLSWKNWIIQIRHPIQTIFEVLIPVAVCAVLIIVRGLVEVTEYTEDFSYYATLTSQIGNVLSIPSLNYVLAYSPENPLLERIVTNVRNDLGLTRVQALHNATELEVWAVPNNPFASIEFDDSLRVNIMKDANEFN